MKLKHLLGRGAGFDRHGLLAAWREMMAPATLLHDVMAGAVIAVSALPLCLAFSVAAGVSPSVAITSAVVGGFLASMLGGSRFSVSGPTSAMAILLIQIAERFGIGGLLTAGLLCGILQVGTGWFRLGKYAQYIPRPVVLGFTGGIGLWIVLLQLPTVLGLGKLSPQHVLPTCLGPGLLGINGPDFAIASVSILVMLAVPRESKVPANLLAILAGLGAALLFALLVPSVRIARIGPLPCALAAPTGWAVPWHQIGELFPLALAMFGLATFETLLTAISCDNQTRTRHDSDQELLGQGIANMVLPFFGGMPVTAGVFRSTVGIRAGSRTRLAAASHALVLLVLTLALADVAAYIPRAALAGTLLVTGCRMVGTRALVQTLRHSRHEGVILIATLLLTVLFNLLVAVTVGLALSVAHFAWRAARQFSAESRRQEPEEKDQRIVVHQVRGPLFFGVIPDFVRAITTLEGRTVLVLDLEAAWGLDNTACEAIQQLAVRFQRQGGMLLLRVRESDLRMLQQAMELRPTGPATADTASQPGAANLFLASIPTADTDRRDRKAA